MAFYYNDKNGLILNCNVCGSFQKWELHIKNPPDPQYRINFSDGVKTGVMYFDTKEERDIELEKLKMIMGIGE